MSSAHTSVPALSLQMLNLLELPHEIIENIFLVLKITDRLALRRTCSVLKDLYDSSAALQYSFALTTSAYINVPNTAVQIPTLQSQNVSNDESKPGSLDPASISPHTGLPRPTVPSVKLAPWPETRPETRDVSNLSVMEKNELLRDRERRWAALDPKQIRSFQVRGSAGVYELQEGIFLMCEDHSEHEKPITIRLIPLPSSHDPDLDNPPVPTKIFKCPFPIADLTMDPSQDLIVVSEMNPKPANPDVRAPAHRFHLFTMSTFEPHPLASQHTLDFPPLNVVSRYPSQLIQIMGETLVALVSRIGSEVVPAPADIPGLLQRQSEEELVAWNWKSGSVLSRLYFDNNLCSLSFTMLSPMTIAVTEPSRLAGRPARIGIYTLHADPSFPQDPQQPLKASDKDITTPRAVPLAQLMLPQLNNGAILSSFQVRPDPAYPVNRCCDAPKLPIAKPFTQDPSKGILVFDISILDIFDLTEEVHESRHSYELFVLRDTLTQIAREGEERLWALWDSERRMGGARIDNNDTVGPIASVLVKYEWSDWGEEKSRMMRSLMSRRLWVCSCSGYRFASLIPTNEVPSDDLTEIIIETALARGLTGSAVDLVVYDFSPYSVQRTDWNTPSDEPYDDEFAAADSFVSGWSQMSSIVVNMPTTIRRGIIWTKDVRTSLPFRQTRRKLDSRPNGIMIDDQRILAVVSSGRENGNWANFRQDVTVMCM